MEKFYKNGKNEKMQTGYRILLLILLPALMAVTGINSNAQVPVTDNLILHLDADAISGLSSNDPVATWDDQSECDEYCNNCKS